MVSTIDDSREAAGLQEFFKDSRAPARRSAVKPLLGSAPSAPAHADPHAQVDQQLTENCR